LIKKYFDQKIDQEIMFSSAFSSTSIEYVEGHKLSTAQLQMFKGTKFCRFFLAGNCERGENCRFAHGLDTLKEPPDFRKTRFCQAFLLTGTCQAGHLCKFAHGRQELRNFYAEKKAGKKSHVVATAEISNEQRLQEQFSILLESFRIKRVLDEALLKLMMKGIQGGQQPDLTGARSDSFDVQEADWQQQSFACFTRQTTIDNANSMHTISRQVSCEEVQVDFLKPSGHHQHYDAVQTDHEQVYVPVIKNTFVHMELQSTRKTMVRSHSSPAIA
jgi:hypothetical protein